MTEYCSFCSKTKHEVAHLVKDEKGQVCICNECILLCLQQLDAEHVEQKDVYMIRIDTEDHLFAAFSFPEALQIAEDWTVKENEGNWEDDSEQKERKYFRDELLESCTRIGRLENP